MKIVISGYYGFNNSGDDALLMSIIEDIKSIDENCSITVLSKIPKQTESNYGVKAISRYNICSLIAEISTCDLLISGGGTLMQDATSTKSLMYYLTIIKIAQIFKRKIMLYANGIGPLTLEKNIEKTRKILNKVSLITLRDEKSRAELEKIGVNKPIIMVTADPAFNLEPDDLGRETLDNYGVPRDKKLLCVSVRSWKNNPKSFALSMSRFCDYAADKYGYFTVFVPMQKKLDYEIAVNIKKKMKNDAVVVRAGYKVDTLLSIMKETDICVGMRLHTLIYSASCEVPLIGIVYDPKISGFMEYMGEDRFINVESINEKQLCEMLDEVCRDYSKIKAGLSVRIRKLKALSKQNIEYVKRLLDGGAF